MGCRNSKRTPSQAQLSPASQRRDARGAKSVTLPYYSTVVRGGNSVIAKRLGYRVTATTRPGTGGQMIADLSLRSAE